MTMSPQKGALPFRDIVRFQGHVAFSLLTIVSELEILGKCPMFQGRRCSFFKEFILWEILLFHVSPSQDGGKWYPHYSLNPGDYCGILGKLMSDHPKVFLGKAPARRCPTLFFHRRLLALPPEPKDFKGFVENFHLHGKCSKRDFSCGLANESTFVLCTNDGSLWCWWCSWSPPWFV